MISTKSILFTGITALMLGNASAQVSQPPQTSLPSKCFEVSRSTNLSEPASPILINRCTGDTWMLVKSRIYDKSGKDTQSFDFEWFPLSVSGQSLVLGYPKPNITQIPPRRGEGPFQ